MEKDYISIHKDIHDRFEELSGVRVQEGTVIDFYSVGISKVMEKAYTEIEENRNPHLYSGLQGKNLDDLGVFLDMPRRPEEGDSNYLFRLMRWVYSAEAGNTISIEDTLLDLEHASAADYIPMTNGAGTASVYIIPKEYTEENISQSIEEVKARISSKISPSVYVEYVIPEIVPVVVYAHIDTSLGDLAQIQSNIAEKFRDHINRIPPMGELKVGELNKIGVNEPNAEYFQVLRMFVSDKEIDAKSVIGNIETKFILQDVVWF